MCGSSSTTRTLKLKAAITSIHPHPVIRMWAGRDGNVNELGLASPLVGRSARALRAPAGWGCTAIPSRGGDIGSGFGAGLSCPPVSARAQDELQRVAHQAEPLPDGLLQVSPVGEMKQADVVDEHHHGRRLRRRLGGITE